MTDTLRAEVENPTTGETMTLCVKPDSFTEAKLILAEAVDAFFRETDGSGSAYEHLRVALATYRERKAGSCQPPAEEADSIVDDGTGIEWRCRGGVVQHRSGAKLFPRNRRPGPWITTNDLEAIQHPARVGAIARARELDPTALVARGEARPVMADELAPFPAEMYERPTRGEREG